MKSTIKQIAIHLLIFHIKYLFNIILNLLIYILYQEKNNLMKIT